MIIFNILKKIIFPFNVIINWGPGVHLHLAGKVLEDNIKNEDFEIIKKNKEYFLYGNVSPDITLGKKYIKEIEKHCHKWETAFNILNKASNDKQKAMSYGYLTHLAADVIAHNYYIPKELLEGRGLRNFLHTVVEIKTDMSIYKDTYSLIKNILDKDYKEEDKFLKENISKAILPFGINRKIFEYSLKSSKSKYLYRAFNIFGKYERWIEENRNILVYYHEISYNLMVDILNNLDKSEILNYDPNGEHNLKLLKKLRKQYKIEKQSKNLKESLYNVPIELLNPKSIDKN